MRFIAPRLDHLRSAKPPRTATARRGATRRTTVRRWPDEHRSGTNRGEVLSRPTTREVGAESDCVRQLVRLRGRPQTPLAEATLTDRVNKYTTRHRPEHGDLSSTADERPPGLGCARSSRQTVTALVATGLQDGSSGTGRHPMTEPVLLRTVTVVRLEGALHAMLLGLTDKAVRGRDFHVTDSHKGTPTVDENIPRLEVGSADDNTGTSNVQWTGRVTGSCREC